MLMKSTDICQRRHRPTAPGSFSFQCLCGFTPYIPCFSLSSWVKHTDSHIPRWQLWVWFIYLAPSVSACCFALSTNTYLVSSKELELSTIQCSRRHSEHLPAENDPFVDYRLKVGTWHRARGDRYWDNCAVRSSITAFTEQEDCEVGKKKVLCRT